MSFLQLSTAEWMISISFEQPAMPAWARTLAVAAGDSIQFKGEGRTSARLARNSASLSIIEIAPAPAQEAMTGDGDPEVPAVEADIVDSVDLKALRQHFGDVSEARFRITDEGAPFISLAGDAEGHPVELRIYLVPFDDA